MQAAKEAAGDRDMAGLGNHGLGVNTQTDVEFHVFLFQGNYLEMVNCDHFLDYYNIL